MFYEVYQRLNHGHNIEDHVVLDHDVRVKGRFKVTSKKGVEVRVFLERGKTLKVGEVLKTECGKEIEILGAEEAVSHAECASWETFSKACYHLGNRHVKIQVGERWLRMKPDYVLEAMLELLGLSVSKENALFIPEDGAYSGGGHAHADDAHDEHSHDKANDGDHHHHH
jgi:urease accessory protein